MTQRFSLWEDLSIREEPDFIARLYGMTNRAEAVDRSLETLGLASRDKAAWGPSGGWALAAACCTRRGSLDEPPRRRSQGRDF